MSPPAPVLQMPIHSASAATFKWSAVSGRSYQFQYENDLDQTNWTNSGDPVTATNAIASASDTIGPDRQRFYRVVLLP